MAADADTSWAQFVKVRHDRVHPLDQATATASSLESRARPPSLAWRTIRTLATVLSNSLLGAAISWLLAFCIVQGNFLSGLSPTEQSHASFVTVKMIWFWAFCWVFTIAECVAKLLPETFTTRGTRTPATLSVIEITIKLVRVMFVHIVGVNILSVGVGLVIASHHDAHEKLKADVYWPMMCYNSILTVTDAHTRHIFRMETVSGQARAIRQRRRTKQPQELISTKKPRRSPSLAQFYRVFVQNLALVFSGLSAGAFVHVASSIEMREKWELVVFAVCSQTIKLVIQAIAKMYLRKRKRTPSVRTMAIIVAAPTILVDTQLRTVLLCLDSKALTLTSSVLLAIAKTFLRLTAGLAARHQAREALKKFPPPQRIPSVEGMNLRVQSLLSSSASSPELEGIARAQKLIALHAAEVYADMHGEYIAMFCAYVITICFGSNPRFLLGGNASTNLTHEIELSTVLVQLGIEVVVDAIAIPLEIRFGINFEKFHKDDAFLAIFMILVAVVSIHIASGVYLKLD